MTLTFKATANMEFLTVIRRHGALSLYVLHKCFLPAPGRTAFCFSGPLQCRGGTCICTDVELCAIALVPIC